MSLAEEMRIIAAENEELGRSKSPGGAENFFGAARAEEERHLLTMVRIAAESGKRFWINQLGEVRDPYTKIAERACVMLMTAHGFRCEPGSTTYHSEESGEYRVCRHVRVIW